MPFYIAFEDSLEINSLKLLTKRQTKLIRASINLYIYQSLYRLFRHVNKNRPISFKTKQQLEHRRPYLPVILKKSSVLFPPHPINPLPDDKF